MGRIGRTYPACELRNSAAACRRFTGPALPVPNAMLIKAMRHKVTGGIMAFIIALGFIGWLLAWPLA
jgi:hypothetical protein